MTDFKIGDKVKIVKKVTKVEIFFWNDAMDDTIGDTDSICDLGNFSFKLNNGWWYLPESLKLVPNDMPEENPHSALIDEYCGDWKKTSTPFLAWQYKSEKLGSNNWEDCDDHPAFHPLCEYRRKPKTININGFDVPEPLSVKPEIGQMYFIVKLNAIRLVNDLVWEDNSYDNCFFERNICHLDAESAQLHAKALLSFTGTKNG